MIAVFLQVKKILKFCLKSVIFLKNKIYFTCRQNPTLFVQHEQTGNSYFIFLFSYNINVQAKLFSYNRLLRVKCLQLSLFSSKSIYFTNVNNKKIFRYVFIYIFPYYFHPFLSNVVTSSLLEEFSQTFVNKGIKCKLLFSIFLYIRYSKMQSTCFIKCKNICSYKHFLSST